MRFEVVERTWSTDTMSRFEAELDEAPKVGESLPRGTMVYRVRSVRLDHDDFDGVIEVERIAGPGQYA